MRYIITHFCVQFYRAPEADIYDRLKTKDGLTGKLGYFGVDFRANRPRCIYWLRSVLLKNEDITNAPC